MKKYKLELDTNKGNIILELSKEQVEGIIKQYNEDNKPTHKRKYFVPKVLETYYYIIVDEINNTSYSPNVDFDKENISIGNCFATEQDAQDELNRRQALVRIWNNYDDKYSWDIDWEDMNQIKYGIALNHFRRIPNVQAESTSYQYTTELPYFKSAEDRNQFVSENESDLLTIFNIKK